MKVTYLFRSKNQHLYSVERVFSSIIPLISRRVSVEEEYMPRYTTKLSAILQNLFVAKKVRADIIHITGDVYYLALVTPKNRTIVTVLDLVSLENHTGIKKLILKHFWYRAPLRRCKSVVTISEKTRTELISTFPELEKKTTTVPCPVSMNYKYTPRVFNKECPTILQIGTKDNKNLIRLAEALSGVKCHLRIIGKLNSEQKDSLEKYNILYTNSFHLSDDEIVEEYKKCDILCFISTYEGFGVPIIEAQATGRIVVTSNIEPMISVAGSCAILVNPYDVQEIHNAIKKIIADTTTREELIYKGVENAKLYYPENIAKQYINLYTKMVSE